MKLSKLFLRFSLIEFLVIKTACEEEPERKQVTKKRATSGCEEKVSIEKMSWNEKPENVICKKQEILGTEGDSSEWNVAKSGRQSRRSLVDSLSEKTCSTSSSSTRISEEIDKKRLVRGGESEYTVQGPSTSGQLEARRELMRRFGSSEEDMACFCEDLNFSMGLDFEGFRKCQLFQTKMRKLDQENRVDLKQDDVLEEKGEECFSMDEESLITLLSGPPTPLCEQLKANPSCKVTLDGSEKDKRYFLKNEKSFSWEDKNAVKDLEEEKIICCTRTCEEGQGFNDNSGHMTELSPGIFSFPSEFSSGDFFSECTTLTASSDRVFSEGYEVGFSKISPVISQHVPGPLNSNTSYGMVATQSCHVPENNKSSFIKENDCALASSTEHKTIPDQDSVEEEPSYSKEIHFAFISKNVKLLSFQEVESRINNTLRLVEKETPKRCRNISLVTSFEIHIYYIAEFCLLFKEWEFFERNNYGVKVDGSDVLMLKNAKMSTEVLLEFTREALVHSCAFTDKHFDPDYMVFNSIYRIDHPMKHVNVGINLDLVFFKKNIRKAFPQEFLSPEFLLRKSEEMEMVIGSINANSSNSQVFFEEGKTDYLKFTFQNLKNIQTIWDFPDYDKTVFNPKKIKTLIEYHCYVFFEDHMELKRTLLPEITSLWLSMFPDGHVIRLDSIKHHLLMLYSLSCLNAFFSSLAKSGFCEFFGDLTNNDSRRRLALCVLFLRKFFMTALLQSLEADAHLLWMYVYFFSVEFLFLLEDGGCYVSIDGSRFNPINLFFLHSFTLQKGKQKDIGSQ